MRMRNEECLICAGGASDMKREYTELDAFIDSLKSYRRVLSRQQIRTIKGQALNGDLDGAQKGLAKMLKRRKA